MQAILCNECPPLAAASAVSCDLHFLERYPELAFYLKGKPLLARRLEAHYQKVCDFVARYVAPQALQIEQRLLEDPNYVPQELLAQACRYRLFSMIFPSALGGAGEHLIAGFMTYELIASRCVGVANLLGVSGLAIGCVLASFDTRALAYIAKLICDNERRGIATFLSTCVTEPEAGSDAEDADEFAAARLRTRARRVQGGYLLNGTKVFISNGSLASLHIVTAYDAAGAHGPDDLLLLMVPKGAQGLSIVRNEKKMGQKVCPASEVLFADVFVCSQGVAAPLALMPENRLLARLFKQPWLAVKIQQIFHSQWADQGFKWLARRQAARSRDAVTAYADVAKVSCSELALENCQKAITLMGKDGLRHPMGAEKLLRDVKLLQIYEGTNQVNMLDFIKRRLMRQFA